MITEMRNAITIIKQINAGEWEFKGFLEFSSNPRSFRCYTAERNGVELWVGNGMYSCGIRNKNYLTSGFGFFIWHFAAKKHSKSLVKKMTPSVRLL